MDSEPEKPQTSEHVVNELVSLLERVLRSRGKARVLGELLCHPRGLTANQLSEKTGEDHSRIYKICNQLVKMSLVYPPNILHQPRVFRVRPPSAVSDELTRTLDRIQSLLSELEEPYELSHSFIEDEMEEITDEGIVETIIECVERARRKATVMVDTAKAKALSGCLCAASNRGLEVRLAINGPCPEVQAVSATFPIRIVKGLTPMAIFDEQLTLILKQSNKKTWLRIPDPATAVSHEKRFQDLWEVD